VKYAVSVYPMTMNSRSVSAEVVFSSLYVSLFECECQYVYLGYDSMYIHVYECACMCVCVSMSS